MRIDVAFVRHPTLKQLQRGPKLDHLHSTFLAGAEPGEERRGNNDRLVATRTE